MIPIDMQENFKSYWENIQYVVYPQIEGTDVIKLLVLQAHMRRD